MNDELEQLLPPEDIPYIDDVLVHPGTTDWEPPTRDLNELNVLLASLINQVAELDPDKPDYSISLTEFNLRLDKTSMVIDKISKGLV